LENEISKKKFPPFSEILRNFEYRAQISKMLKAKEFADTINLQDDHPTIVFRPWVEGTNNE
jgi:hypothetical protein